MIKRLRWKMVGINMAIVTAVLLTVFASVFFISRAGLAHPRPRGGAADRHL